MIYYLLILIPYIFYIFEKKIFFKKIKFFWLFSFFIFLFLIGFRNNIGGDWNSYLINFENFTTFNYNIKFINIFYVLIFIFNKINLNINILYFLLSFFYLFTLYLYCSFFKYKWMALLSTMPYLTNIVSTGYVKQSLAISFLFLVILKFLENKKNRNVITYLFLSIFSHISSIIFFVITINFKYFKYLLLITIIFLVFFYKDIYNIVFPYLINPQKQSDGFYFRIITNILYLIPIFYLFLKNKLSYQESFLFISNGLFIIFTLIFILIIQETSTFLDRFNLYMLILYPLYTNLIITYHNNFPLIRYLNLNSILLIFLVLNLLYFFLWSNFGNAYIYWKNYDNILINLILNFF